MVLTVTLNASIDKRYVVRECRQGEVNRVSQCSRFAGGKGLNAARTAVVLGEQVMAAGILRGHSGQYIAEELKKQEILNCCIQTSGENRSCINIYDEKTGKQTEYLEPGEAISTHEQERFMASYGQLLKHCDVVSISGSILPGMDRTIYGTMVVLAKKEGVPVIVDTSGDLLVHAIDGKPDVIKPNLDEIKAYAGGEPESEEELIEVGKELQKKGIGMVVISMGERGSLAVTKKSIYRIHVPVIAAANTVGCGDAMTAGLAVGIAKGLKTEQILILAASVSAANALREETGFFLKEDMERLEKEIRITVLHQTAPQHLL